MRLSALSTAVAERAGVLCCVLFMVISAQALAQTSATDNPSPTAAQASVPAQEKPAAAAEEKPPAADDKPGLEVGIAKANQRNTEATHAGSKKWQHLDTPSILRGSCAAFLYTLTVGTALTLRGML